MPRTTLTSLADDLASRGYVVASVDHAYESVGTAFPGGRMLTCVACERVDTPEEQAAVVRGRAKDMSFVISELTSGREGGRAVPHDRPEADRNRRAFDRVRPHRQPWPPMVVCGLGSTLDRRLLSAPCRGRAR